MALPIEYHELWFESFPLKSTSGHRDSIALRLRAGQKLPAGIKKECRDRSVKPRALLLECSKKLLTDYPLGTRFRLNATLTDREGEGLFFYTYHGWPPIKFIEPASGLE